MSDELSARGRPPQVPGRFVSLSVCLCVIAAACSTASPPHGHDAGVFDAGDWDAGRVDAGSDAGMTDGGVRVSCSVPADCSDVLAAPVCDPASKTCVECLTDSQCPASEVCGHDMFCRGTKPCATSEDCEPIYSCGGGTCNLDPGRCQADGDCKSPSEPRCDSQTLTCVQCVVSADCGDGQYCAADACQACSEDDPNHCGTPSSVPGCAVCSDGTTCSNGSCVCTSDASCGDGQYCSEGACHPCSSTDADHCGTTTSPPGCMVCMGLTPTCSDGTCFCASDADCGPGRYCSGGACQSCSQTDPNHCGTATSAAGCSVCSGETRSCTLGYCTPPGFAYIPPDTFTMGSPPDEPGRYGDETQHQVTISHAFYMEVADVTQGEWQAVMGANPSWVVERREDDCPVEMVSWWDAVNYANTLSERSGLPDCYGCGYSETTWR